MYFIVGRVSFSSIEFIKVTLKQKHTLSAAWQNLPAVITFRFRSLISKLSLWVYIYIQYSGTCKKAWKFRMNTLLTSLNFLQDLIFITHTDTLFYLFRLFLTNQVEEKAKFDGIFESLLPVNGLLSGDKVKPVLMNSKLPLDILGRVSKLFRFSYSLYNFLQLQC